MVLALKLVGGGAEFVVDQAPHVRLPDEDLELFEVEIRLTLPGPLEGRLARFRANLAVAEALQSSREPGFRFSRNSKSS